jgi:hypothetical protein
MPSGRTFRNSSPTDIALPARHLNVVINVAANSLSRPPPPPRSSRWRRRIDLMLSAANANGSVTAAHEQCSEKDNREWQAQQQGNQPPTHVSTSVWICRFGGHAVASGYSCLHGVSPQFAVLVDIAADVEGPDRGGPPSRGPIPDYSFSTVKFSSLVASLPPLAGVPVSLIVKSPSAASAAAVTESFTSSSPAFSVGFAGVTVTP